MKIIRLSRSGSRVVRATVVLLHGLGDSGDGWRGGGDALVSLLPAGVEVVLPTAPVRPVTLNMGMRMNAWYDLKDLSESRDHESCEGIDDSAAMVGDLLTWAARPRRSLPPGESIDDVSATADDANSSSCRSTVDETRLPIVLAGFSQGGALSLYKGLRVPELLKGIIVMSGYLPLAHSFSPSGY